MAEMASTGERGLDRGRAVIVFHNPYYNAFCDGCGHMLPAEKDRDAAGEAMRTDGWIKAEGKNLCRLCQRKWRETGKIPDQRLC